MTLSHGLYYIHRGATQAYVLSSSQDLPALASADKAVLGSLIELAEHHAQKATIGARLDPPADPVPPGDNPNPLGLPMGVYYVPTDSTDVYSLTGETPPALSRAEAAVALGLVRHAAYGHDLVDEVG